MLAAGPWRPALCSRIACLLLSAWIMLEASSRVGTADEQGWPPHVGSSSLMAPRALLWLDLPSVVGIS